MTTSGDRRDFLNAVALGAGVTGALVASSRTEAQLIEPPEAGGRVFKGTSKRGDFKEALDNAIQAAMATARGNDRQVRWTFVGMSGLNGGVVGAHEVTVTIQAVIH